MFSEKKKKPLVPSNNNEKINTETVLTEGVTIKDGNLSGTSGVTIAGVFFGDIDIEGVLIISKSGNFKGNVTADDAYIHGAVEGNISVKGKVHIYTEGKAFGDVLCSSFVVEEGASFRGQCCIADTQAANSLNAGGKKIRRQAAEMPENETAANEQLEQPPDTV